jgi:hypothetical protein
MPPCFAPELQFDTLDEYLKKAEAGDVVYLQEGRIPVQKLEYVGQSV